MSDGLECVDRWGRRIVVEESAWYDKIVVDHGEVAGSLDAVELTLTAPDRVDHDAEHDDGENFYRRGVLQHPYDGDYLKVVVRFDSSTPDVVGTVVSAYAVRRFRKRGETFKWGK